MSNLTPSLRFSPSGSNSFIFDTGIVRGRLHADGVAKGLSAVVHVRTGITLDRSLGLCSHYRVFTANKRYGVAAWEWPSQAKLEPDGAVSVRWPASGERPFELRARYRWATADALDVETSVLAHTHLKSFESFLAAYFAPVFSNSLVYVQHASANAGHPGFMAAERSFGTWQAFPRDDSAIELIRDGRWELQPNPVHWTLRPTFAKPIGVRRAPAVGLTAVLLSPPAECFAICTPEETESHYSLYLSLFGHDLAAGQTSRARARLLLGTTLSDQEILAAGESYLRALPTR